TQETPYHQRQCRVAHFAPRFRSAQSRSLARWGEAAPRDCRATGRSSAARTLYKGRIGSLNETLIRMINVIMHDPPEVESGRQEFFIKLLQAGRAAHNATAVPAPGDVLPCIFPKFFRRKFSLVLIEHRVRPGHVGVVGVHGSSPLWLID